MRSSRLRTGPRSAAIVFLLGMAVTLLMWQDIRAREHGLREAEFDLIAQECIDSVERSLLMYLEAVHAIADYIAAAPRIHRRGFHEFSAPLLERHRPIQALEWIPKVLRADREQHEAGAAEEGLAAYRILEASESGPLSVARDRPEYFPVLYIEPLERNRPALGFDLASEPVRREALQVA
ncbi:MAG: CHASE domain-containing protein, partial [Deltaproteobacteria bacterium]|nr:CHASE domain-containing protein [Deltaproteobacteria bacterium]